PTRAERAGERELGVRDALGRCGFHPFARGARPGRKVAAVNEARPRGAGKRIAFAGGALVFGLGPRLVALVQGQAAFEQIGEIVTGGGHALCGGLAVELERRWAVLLHADPEIVEHAEVVLAVGLALV